MSSDEAGNSDEEQQPVGKDFVPFDDLDAAEAGINVIKGEFALLAMNADLSK